MLQDSYSTTLKPNRPCPLPLLLSSAAGVLTLTPTPAQATRETSMGALDGKDYGKERMTFSDYVSTPSGLQYFDFRTGAGPTPTPGQLCVIDWTGVTIGYYGRPFEAKNKTKGSSFNDDDKDYFRFRLGADNVIAGVQEAVAGMQVGGIRRVIVPWELSYPNGDFKNYGPTPTTFSGKRALGFVVESGPDTMIDKTLQFDIKLVRVE